jgi:hypothetical protein
MMAVMSPSSPHIQFRAGTCFAEELRARAHDPEVSSELSRVASTAAQQLFRLYAAELRDIRRLSRDDCVMIAAALWSTTLDSSWVEYAPVILAEQIQESAEDDLGEAAHTELAGRVRCWTRLQALAVIDAVERLKVLRDTAFDEGLIQVGLQSRWTAEAIRNEKAKPRATEPPSLRRLQGKQLPASSPEET